MLGVGGVGRREVVKQKKHAKVFTGNLQFSFCAPTKKPLFCHPAYVSQPILPGQLTSYEQLLSVTAGIADYVIAVTTEADIHK